jgi:hypothetical protein
MWRGPLGMDQWTSFLSSFVTGIGSSVIASMMFIHLYMARKVPRLLIADQISNEIDKGGSFFWFKYINQTGAAIYDVRIEATLVTPEGSDGGQNLGVEYIEFSNRSYTYVPAESKLDSNALHAVQVRCSKDLHELWSNSASFLRLQIIAKHELSGLSKVFIKDYHTTSKIKKGSFAFGNDLSII